MAGRRQAREIAFQMLYQQDLNPGLSPQTVRDMISSRLQATSLGDFAWTLFAGTTDVLTNLDLQIEAVAQNWSLKRMAPTDRNILRLGAYELLHTDTPHEVVIDEAIELAKRFSAAQSPLFVNGILDRLIPDKQETNTASGQVC